MMPLRAMPRFGIATRRHAAFADYYAIIFAMLAELILSATPCFAAAAATLIFRFRR